MISLAADLHFIGAAYPWLLILVEALLHQELFADLDFKKSYGLGAVPCWSVPVTRGAMWRLGIYICKHH